MDRIATDLEATMAKKRKQNLVVTVSGNHPIHEVASKLKATGFEVNEVLDAIGVVTGSAPATSLAKMRKVSGVADVSVDHPVSIGPPGAPVT
jgi:hypothetical protein